MNNPNDPNDKKIYCDLCCVQPNGSLVWNEHARMAMVDGPTKSGPWAYMCYEHRDSAGWRHSKMNTVVNREFRWKP